MERLRLSVAAAGRRTAVDSSGGSRIRLPPDDEAEMPGGDPPATLARSACKRGAGQGHIRDGCALAPQMRMRNTFSRRASIALSVLTEFLCGIVQRVRSIFRDQHR